MVRAGGGRVARGALDAHHARLRYELERALMRHRLDHMERPTSALHLSRVTLDLRQLNAEPHTKEVGHVEVYDHYRVRSACGDDGRRGPAAGAADAGVAHAHV